MQLPNDIPERMKSVVCFGPGDYRMEELEVPRVDPGEVLVKVLAVGICAGDAKCYAGAPHFWGDSDRPAYVQPPVTPGHEFIGKVVGLGEGSGKKYGLEIGDHAISEQIVPCWDCRFCFRGGYHMCVPHDIYGFHQRSHGAMASYMKYPSGSINHKVPKSIPAWQAAFIEPLSCAIHAVELGNIQFNHVVVVSGCGPLGLGMVAAAKQKNPAKLVALDLFDWKLDVAKECGADIVLNPNSSDVIAEIKQMTDGYGCDVYIEATGHPSSVVQGLHMTAKLGTFVEYSVFGKETTADWTIISDMKGTRGNTLFQLSKETTDCVAELTVQGGHLSPNCYPKAISMLSHGDLPMDRIITHKLPLEDFQKGIDLVNSSSESIKIVLFP